MVLESLVSAREVLKKPHLLAIYGFFIALASVLVCNFFFPYVSILSLAFITIASSHVTHSILSLEERETATIKPLSLKFLERNLLAIKVYGYFSIGIMLAYTFLYIILPEQSALLLPSKSIVFAEQEKTLEAISELSNRNVGYATVQLRSNAFFYWFTIIFINNASVLLAAVLFSFIFGAGAAFLISWNASVVGTWIGKAIQASNHLKILGILPHALPEFAGYFLGATAGGLISIAISKRRKLKHEIETIASDSALMLVLAFCSIALGAAIEASAIAGMQSIAALCTASYMLVLLAIIYEAE